MLNIHKKLTPWCRLLILLLCGALLCGCTHSSADTTASTDASPETTVPQTTNGTTDPNAWIIDENAAMMTGTVRFATPLKLDQGMTEMVEEFNKVYPNIQIKLEHYDQTNLDFMLRTDTIDVFHILGFRNLSQCLYQQNFYDITELLNDEGVDIAKTWGTDIYNYYGHYFSIPLGGLQFYIAINKTAWDEAGLGDIPTEWTWDEYLAACKAMTKTSDDGSIRYGGSSYSSSNTFLYCYAQVNGGDIYYTDDWTKSSYSSPITLNALERQLKAELQDQIWFPSATYCTDNIKEYTLYCNGTLASTVTWNMTRFLAEEQEQIDWVTAFAPFPTEEEGQTNYMSGAYPHSHIAMTDSCQNIDASWAFIKWFSIYGNKYICKYGYQPTWTGTTSEDIIDLLYGSEDTASGLMDVESFKRVIGRTDLPSIRETTAAAYREVANALYGHFLQAANGLISAEECLKLTCETADGCIAASGLTYRAASPGANSSTAEDQLIYTVNADGKTCSVVKTANESATEIVIPESIDGYTVTAIGDYAFSNHQCMKSITMPNSITSIGDHAFDRCIGLESITFPENLESIGISAFHNCSSLIDIVLPSSLQHLGDSAFSGCVKLTSVHLDARLSEIPNKAFDNSYALENITIPDSVTSIGEYAFSCCRSLKTLIIPDSVTAIYQGAFGYCESLESLVLPENASFPDGFSIRNCSSLTSIILPEAVTEIKREAFADCVNLSAVTLPSGIVMLMPNLFSGCANLTELTFNGTISQWYALPKTTAWLDGSSIRCIRCTNGSSTLRNEELMNQIKDYWSLMNLSLTSCYTTAADVDLYQFFYNGVLGTESSLSNPH